MKLNPLVLAFGLIPLVGCGSDSDDNSTATDATSSTYSVTAIDGYLNGAQVWLDIDGDYLLDDNEPSAISDEGGVADLDVTTVDNPEQYAVVVQAIAGQTIDIGDDVDNPEENEPIETSYMMSAPAGETDVTPLSTLVHVILEQNVANEASGGSELTDEEIEVIKNEAVSEVAGLLGIDSDEVLGDFIEEENDAIAYAAENVVAAKILPKTPEEMGEVIEEAKNDDPDDNTTGSAFLATTEAVTNVIKTTIEKVEVFAAANEAAEAAAVAADNGDANAAALATAAAEAADAAEAIDKALAIAEAEAEALAESQAAAEAQAAADAEAAAAEAAKTAADAQLVAAQLAAAADAADAEAASALAAAQAEAEAAEAAKTAADSAADAAKTDADAKAAAETNAATIASAAYTAPETFDASFEDLAPLFSESDDPNVDSDGDGVPDFLDTFPDNSDEWVDNDNDGTGNNTDTDDDDDTVLDADDAFPFDATETTDNDGDYIGDNADLDDDNDGTLDTVDAFPLNADEDTDTDSDGTGDNADDDDDGDGTLDTVDAFPTNSAETTDTDGDGIGNNADLDDDADGTPDTADAFPTNSAETTDTDGDGTGDNADTDDDNDGTLDTADAFPTNSAETTDTDGDGTGNNADTDDDNDGTLDTADAFPTDPTETIDTDEDGTGDNADAFDNDPTETTDTDGDGVGDNADAFDNDANETTDTDGDGVGDNADDFPTDATETTDSDGDSVGDNADDFPTDASETTDTDGDGIGDNTDTDADGNGVLDADEQPALIGTWSNASDSFTFTETTYSHTDLDNDGECAGTETGTYTYDKTTGTLTPTSLDVNGDGYCGFYNDNDELSNYQVLTLTTSESGNYLTLAYEEEDEGNIEKGSFDLYKVLDTAATAFVTANANFSFLDIEMDDDGNGDIEVEYDDVQWNSSNNSLTTTMYTLDNGQLVETTDDGSDYILTTNGWDYAEYGNETLTPQDDGSVVYSDNYESTTITGVEWSLANANIAQFQESVDIDEEVLAYFDESAAFSDGAAAYVMSSVSDSAEVYSLWLYSCDDTSVLLDSSNSDSCNYQSSTTDGSAITSVESITASSAFVEGTSPNEFAGTHWDNNYAIRLVKANDTATSGSVDIYTLDWDNNTTAQVSGEVTWQEIIVHGQTLITFSTEDDSLSDFNERFLTEVGGYLRAGNTWSNDDDSEVMFNATAKDDILGAFDSDGDGVGNATDAFPSDADETTDTDGDGTGDNEDAFPLDATEDTDTDGDDTGDNADAFPYDNTETTDTDGDGTGDNADAFPLDAAEDTDTDGDNIGDNADTDANGNGVPDADEQPALIGTWSNAEISFTFNVDMTYSMEQKTSDDETSDSTTGTETGVYAYNETNGAITVSEITLDNNGTSGLSDMLDETETLSFSLSEADSSGNNLTFAYDEGDEQGTFVLYKELPTTATAFVTANANFSFLDIEMDDDGNGDIEVEYDNVQWNSSNNSLTTTMYTLDNGQLVETTDDGSDYILTTNGWDYAEYGNETLTPQDDGSVVYSDNYESTTITGVEWSLANANIAQFQESVDIDEEVLAYFDESAAFSDGAAAYVISSVSDSAEVYSLWLYSCDDTSVLLDSSNSDSCNYQSSTTDGSAITSVESITASSAFVEGTSPNEFAGTYWDNNYAIRLVKANDTATSGSVDIYTLDWDNNTTAQVSGEVTWQEIIVHDQTLITFSTEDDSLSDFNERFLTEVGGYLRAGNTWSNDDDSEVMFNATAKDDILGAFDSDGDGVGNATDAFPSDADETTDTDGDGTGDNEDAFPLDATEDTDTDGDDTGDNADAFPSDNTETTDTDGDGTGDNADAFPLDAAEDTDTDGDNIGDNADTDANGNGVPDADEQSPLIGTWSNAFASFTFTSTTYSMEERGENDSCDGDNDSCNGTEEGVYTYNATTGAITVSEITSDNNGTSGLSDMLIENDSSFALDEADPSGNYLTFAYVDVDDESGTESGTFTLYKTQDTSATDYITANSHFFFLDLEIDDGEIEYGYDDVLWNGAPDYTLSSTIYGFDFSSQSFVEGTDSDNDYILTSDGWGYVDEDSLTETLTPQTDGSVVYSNGVEADTITGQEWSLSGANIAQFMEAVDVDEGLLGYINESATFSDGASAYVMTSESSSDSTYSMWLSECGDYNSATVTDTGLCNSFTATMLEGNEAASDLQVESIAQITHDSAFDSSQDARYFEGMYYNNWAIRLLSDNTVDVYSNLDWYGGTNIKADGIVTWESVTVKESTDGETTLIKFSTEEDSLSDFNQLNLTALGGYVRGVDEWGDSEEDDEVDVMFNATAKADIIDSDVFDVSAAAASINTTDGSGNTSGDSTFAFTTEWLNGKTLYNVYLETDEAEDYWATGVFTFTDTTFSAYDLDDPSDAITDIAYTITDEGYITYACIEDCTEGAMDYIRMISSEDDYLTLKWSDNIDDLTNSDNDQQEFFFYEQATAEQYISDNPVPSDSSTESVDYSILTGNYVYLTETIIYTFDLTYNEDDDTLSYRYIENGISNEIRVDDSPYTVGDDGTIYFDSAIDELDGLSIKMLDETASEVTFNIMPLIGDTVAFTATKTI